MKKVFKKVSHQVYSDTEEWLARLSRYNIIHIKYKLESELEECIYTSYGVKLLYFRIRNDVASYYILKALICKEKVK